MTTIKKTTFALATGLLASMLASPTSMAQMAKPASGLIPGQSFAVTISDPGGMPIVVVAAGRIPLASEPRVALFLPDLESLGDQELVYTLHTDGPTGLSSEALGKPQWVVGRVHAEVILAPAGAELGSQTGSTGPSILILGSDGIEITPVPDLEDDIVWIDPCVHGAYEAPGIATLGTGEGVLEGSGGAGSLNVATSLDGSKAP